MPNLHEGERGSCRAWLWLGRSLALPVEANPPLAEVAEPIPIFGVQPSETPIRGVSSLLELVPQKDSLCHDLH